MSDPQRTGNRSLLGAESSRVEDNSIASVLAEALRSGLPEKRTAVLDRLTLPNSKTVNPEVMRLLGNVLEGGEMTALDPLYDGFLKALEIANPNKLAAPVARIPAAQEALVGELVKLTVKAELFGMPNASLGKIGGRPRVPPLGRGTRRKK